jgi:hypothetical protein
MEEKQLSAAQIDFLRKLYSEFSAAQKALNEFTRYLLEEYDLVAESSRWQLAPSLDRFVMLPDQSAKEEPTPF